MINKYYGHPSPIYITYIHCEHSLNWCLKWPYFLEIHCKYGPNSSVHIDSNRNHHIKIGWNFHRNFIQIKNKKSFFEKRMAQKYKGHFFFS